MNDATDAPVQATTTSMHVLDTVVDLDGAPLTDITRELSLSKSSVHNHLQTLEQLGLVVKTGMEYRASLRFLEIGATVRRRVPFYAVAREEVDRLAEASGLAVSLVVFERDRGICLYTATGQRMTSPPVEEGTTVPLHASAAGKAILAELPAAELDGVLETLDFEALTAETTTDADELHSQLSTVRTRGIAAEREEWHADISGLATGFSTDDGVHGCIYVLSRSESMSGKQFQQDIPGLLSGATNQIRQAMRDA